LALTNYLHVHGLKQDYNLSYRVYLDSLKPDFIQDDHHGFYIDEISQGIKIPATVQRIDPHIKPEWYYKNNDIYTENLQNTIGGKNDAAGNNSAGTLVYEIRKIRNTVSQYLPTSKFIMQPQIHGLVYSDEATGLIYEHGLREPTNEEIQVQAMISLAHGANGLCWFIYNSKIDSANNIPSCYTMGMLQPEDGISKRISNCYGQNKWTYVSQMNGKLLNWAPTLENINYQDGFSVHQNGAGNFYLEDILSLKRNSSGNFVNNDDIKYWEEGFYFPKDQSDRSQYLMMVNRRCVPETTPEIGDIRQLKIKFKASELEHFNNWIIEDINTGQKITFNKNNQGTDGYLNLGSNQGDIGYFLPGEGKLYKIAPVMQEGGTFVCDEEVINQQFVCKGQVYTSGKNLEIKSENSGQTIISFNQDCGIIAENSPDIFVEGTAGNKVIFKGNGNNKWNGIALNNCGDINFENTEFSNINGNWAISVTNSLLTNIYSSNFYLSENQSRAINVNCLNLETAAVELFNYNITVKSPTAAICIIGANSEITSLIDNNSIVSTENGGIGIFASNNYNLINDNNNLNGFVKGINFVNSMSKMTNSTISANINNSKGIMCNSGTELLIGEYYGNIYGLNTISNCGQNCRNIEIENSTFSMDYGHNALNVNLNTNSFNMHGTGVFGNSDEIQEYIEVKENCFNNGPGNDALCDVRKPTGYLYSLHQLPHYCDFQQDVIADYIFPVTGETVDTVYKLSNAQPNTTELMQLNKGLIRNFLQRNYDSASHKAYTLLNSYSDSIFAPTAIKLGYYSLLKTDSAGEKISGFKTFLEQIILNHPLNVSLVKSANYYIQKCKVQLNQYTSALTGFQDIIVQNPYTYDGLIASWDYAATQLLVNSGGAYKDNSLELYPAVFGLLNPDMIYLNASLSLNKFIKSDKYDPKKFTKEERIVIITSVGNVLNQERNKQIEKIKDLEKKVEDSELRDEKVIKQKIIKLELEEAKRSNSVIKTKTPKDEKEYIAIVKNDIDKIGKTENISGKNEITSLPTTYELKQNYPNPFNSSTNVQFQMVNEGRVKLVIYDILGREVKVLVNEIRQAGVHKEIFDAGNLSSGVYFLRIIVNEGKDFIDVKKMVLIK